MGDPRKQRKKYEAPRFAWRPDIIQDELRLVGQYGLRNKRELWKNKTMLSKFRGIARSLIGQTQEERGKKEQGILARLKKLGIIHQTAVLDNVLDLTIEDILERRLQTIVYREGLAKSIHQARQLITHGHIAIDEKRVTSPSYLVTREEEQKIAYTPQSPLTDPSHPLRQKMTDTALPEEEEKNE